MNARVPQIKRRSLSDMFDPRETKTQQLHSPPAHRVEGKLRKLYVHPLGGQSRKPSVPLRNTTRWCTRAHSGRSRLVRENSAMRSRSARLMREQMKCVVPPSPQSQTPLACGTDTTSLHRISECRPLDRNDFRASEFTLTILLRCCWLPDIGGADVADPTAVLYGTFSITSEEHITSICDAFRDICFQADVEICSKLRPSVYKSSKRIFGLANNNSGDETNSQFYFF